MNLLFVETEAKLFCLLAIGFLAFFHKKTFLRQTEATCFTYLFAFIGVLFSTAEGMVVQACVKNIFLTACSCYFMLAIFYWQKQLFFSAEKKPIAQNSVALLIGGAFGILTFFLLKWGINAPIYAMTLAVMLAVVVAQYNKIRIDNLTGLYNRYGLEAELAKQLRQYEHEHSDSFYIIACDLDDFKHINDTWGHLEGNRALILVADALLKVSKMFNANAFRIGGDEFVVITDTSEKGLAVDAINAIKKELDSLKFREDYDIKMSMGFALYDGVTPIDDLLDNADKKLYEAKKHKGE